MHSVVNQLGKKKVHVRFFKISIIHPKKYITVGFSNTNYK